MMTRKDYEAIAGAVMEARDALIASLMEEEWEGAHYALDVAARRLNDHLAADNPRFDRDRFLKACGAI